eukprot:gene14633-16151_t
MLHVLASLDLDTIFGYLCGERLKNGKIKLFLGEAELQRYGKDDFDKFFAYVCSSDHIKKFCFKEDEREIQEDETGNTESDILFHPEFATNHLHRIKQAVKRFLWHRNCAAKWFALPETTTGNLVKLELSQYSEKKPYCLGNVYAPTFSTNETPIYGEFNEVAVYQSIYQNKELFMAIGIEAVDRIEKVYIGSDKEASIPKHILPILGDRAKYAGDERVLKRLQETKSVRLPFRL